MALCSRLWSFASPAEKQTLPARSGVQTPPPPTPRWPPASTLDARTRPSLPAASPLTLMSLYEVKTAKQLTRKDCQLYLFLTGLKSRPVHVILSG